MSKHMSSPQTNTTLLNKGKLSTYTFWLTLNIFFWALVYPCFNYLAHNNAPYTFYMLWELNIPFVSWAIIPYLSLNLLFFVNYMVIPQILIKKLGFAFLFCTLISGLVFYSYPANLGFERTLPDGFFYKAYQCLFLIDLPHNLFPSLHASYTTLFALTTIPYIKNKAVLSLYISWIIMIMLSIVFTHQHHCIDLLGGILIAIIGWFSINIFINKF